MFTSHLKHKNISVQFITRDPLPFTRYPYPLPVTLTRYPLPLPATRVLATPLFKLIYHLPLYDLSLIDMIYLSAFFQGFAIFRQHV